ncbi:lectin BRA-3-like [Diadema antillarum]|uniref:lectin BRA-3-like n=1 Tax=Diadema antillarum TaxID=105358 RepID=UPI003A86D38B
MSTTTWYEAFDFCDTLPPVQIGLEYRYPSLLVFESFVEFDFFVNEIASNNSSPSDSYWLNCNDLAVEGEWICLVDREGNTTQFRNWRTGEPNNWHNGVDGQDCGRSWYETFEYDDLFCDNNGKVKPACHVRVSP